MKVFCVIPAEDDATSFYRGLYPVAMLGKYIPNFHFECHGENILTRHLLGKDVVFLQRPANEGAVKLMQLCKELKIKTWLDYDDQIFKIPDSNPCFYDAFRAKEWVKKCLDLADVISVSTKKLGMELAQYLTMEKDKKKNIHVIPNAFNDYLLTEKSEFKMIHIHKKKLGFWRGTTSHQEDLLQFSGKMVEVIKRHPDWHFNFAGYKPFFMLNKLGVQGSHTDGKQILEYHKFIKLIYPNLSVVTLSKSDFNECKSNIAWIEGTYAGAVTLAPEWEEWKKPGIMTYDTVTSFGKLLDMTMDLSEETLRKLHSQSWEFISDTLRLSKINQHRANLLEEVLSS